MFRTSRPVDEFEFLFSSLLNKVRFDTAKPLTHLISRKSESVLSLSSTLHSQLLLQIQRIAMIDRRKRETREYICFILLGYSSEEESSGTSTDRNSRFQRLSKKLTGSLLLRLIYFNNYHQSHSHSCYCARLIDLF
jgi:hypothetical protein